jgi:hypothetical protein
MMRVVENVVAASEEEKRIFESTPWVSGCLFYPVCETLLR